MAQQSDTDHPTRPDAEPPSQVEEMLLERNEKKLVDVFGGQITEDQISVVIEEPKKKNAATIAAAAAALVPAQGSPSHG